MNEQSRENERIAEELLKQTDFKTRPTITQLQSILENEQKGSVQINPDGSIGIGGELFNKITKALAAKDAALRKAVETEREEAAKIVDAKEKELLSKQYKNPTDFEQSVNTNIRMVAVILPEIAAAIRQRGEAS